MSDGKLLAAEMLEVLGAEQPVTFDDRMMPNSVPILAT